MGRGMCLDLDPGFWVRIDVAAAATPSPTPPILESKTKGIFPPLNKYRNYMRSFS